MKKVLVVDNEPIICRLIKRTLESETDYEVSVCTDSGEAFQVIKTQLPDIVLVDVSMPELSGPELVQQLRTDKITRDIPCVYMTGNLVPSNPVDQDDLTTVSIAKPFSRAELIDVIDRVLKGK